LVFQAGFVINAHELKNGDIIDKDDYFIKAVGPTMVYQALVMCLKRKNVSEGSTGKGNRIGVPVAAFSQDCKQGGNHYKRKDNSASQVIGQSRREENRLFRRYKTCENLEKESRC